MNKHLAKAFILMNKNKIYDIAKVVFIIALGLTVNAFSDSKQYSHCWVPLALAGAGIAASLFGGKKKAPAPPKAVDILERATTGKYKGTSLAERQATGLFSQYYPMAIPLALQTSAEYGPQIMAQMFGQTGQFLGGVGGQPGFQELQRTTGIQAGRTLADLRAAELGQQTGQAGLTRGLMEALSPEQAAAVSRAAQTAAQAQGLESDFMGRAGGMMGQYGSQVGQYDPTISGANADVSRATQMAEESFARRDTLSPEEQRMAQQQAREAGAASGRLGGNAAIAAEIQNREAAKAARRGEAAQFGQQAFTQQLGAAGQQLAAEQALFSQGIAGGAQRAQERQLGFGQLMDIEQRRALAREEAAQAGQRSYGMAGEFYTNPGLAALRNAPISYTAGQQDLRTALSLGPASSGDFDYNTPLNYASQLAGAQNQANQAAYQANLANQQAKSQMWSSIGSTLLGAGLGGMGGVSGSNFASFLGSGNFGNAGTALQNIGLGAMGQPLKAYTV
jgi:hypothetical protein